MHRKAVSLAMHAMNRTRTAFIDMRSAWIKSATNQKRSVCIHRIRREINSSSVASKKATTATRRHDEKRSLAVETSFS